MIKFLKSILYPPRKPDKDLPEAWPRDEMKRTNDAMDRAGLPRLLEGDRDWLKRINDLIEQLEKK